MGATMALALIPIRFAVSKFGKALRNSCVPGAVIILALQVTSVTTAPAPSLASFKSNEVLVGFRDGVNPSAVIARVIPGARSPERVVPIAKVAANYRSTHAFNIQGGRTIFRGRTYSNPKNISEEELFAEAELTMPAHARALYRIYRIDLADTVAVAEAIARLSSNPDVQFAQPNNLHVMHGLPQDPYVSTNGVTWSAGSWGQDEDLDEDGVLDAGEDFDGNGVLNAYPDLWGLQRINAIDAWSLSQGQGVVVAVVDSGVAYNHPDFFRDENANGIPDPGEQSNMWVNSGEDLNGDGLSTSSDFEGRDTDGNGYVDDLRGFDFSSGDSYPYDDLFGHGTHVAGTIAAVAGNGIGIAGVAPKARIMPLKIFPSATDADAVRAIHYAVDNGARIINNSWGPASPTYTNMVLAAAIEYAVAAGVAVVFSAGNSGGALYAPANHPDVIAVTATTPGDKRTEFTCRGPEADIAAPGGGSSFELGGDQEDAYNILSLLAPSTETARFEVAPGYARLGGTSMAAAHVSGVAAIVLARDGALSPVQLLHRLKDTSDPIADGTLGAGRLNPEAAVQVQLKLTTPAQESWVHGPLTVEGTASFPGPFTWELTIAPSNDLENCRSLRASSTPVVDGELLPGWSTIALRDGDYTLRLSLTCPTRVFSVSRQVHIDNVNDPPEVLSPTSEKIAVFGTSLVIPLKVADPDDPSTPEGQLNFRPLKLPAGAKFDSKTQFLTWAPGAPCDDQAQFVIEDNENQVPFPIRLSTVVFIPNLRSPATGNVQPSPAVSDDTVVWIQDNAIRARIGTWEGVVDPTAQNPSSVSIEDHQLAWVAGVSNGTRQLFTYDLDADPGWFTNGVTTLPGTQLTTTSSNSVSAVDINGGRIAYTSIIPSLGGPSYQLAMVDLSSGVHTVVAGSSFLKSGPRMDGNRIVCAEFRSGPYFSILLHDLVDGQQTFVASGVGGVIQGERIIYITNHADDRLMLYDIARRTATNVPVGDVKSAAIWGDTLAISLTGYHPTVVLHDLASGCSVPVGSLAPYGVFYHQTYPAIHGNHVAWNVSEFTFSGGTRRNWVESAFYYFVPRVESVVVNGRTATIKGRRFGAGRVGQVLLGGTPVPVTCWNDGEISAELPYGTVGGALTAATPGGTSTPMYFYAGDLPVLQVRLEGASLCLSWPTNFDRFVLEQKEDLTSPAPWSLVTEGVTAVGERFQCRTTGSGSQRYFRLGFRP